MTTTPVAICFRLATRFWQSLGALDHTDGKL
jgi:hypothetical protein